MTARQRSILGIALWNHSLTLARGDGTIDEEDYLPAINRPTSSRLAVTASTMVDISEA